MDMTVDRVQADVPVTILALHGALDASNYEQVVAKAQELYNAGMRHLVLDMSDVPFMGSSGLVALHCIAMLLRGEELPDPQEGWQVLHDIDRDRSADALKQLKLLNPQPKILRTLEMTGMAEFFAIYDDRETALRAF